MFDNIPAEMRAWRQWILWRYVDRGGLKPTKLPFQVSGEIASVTDAATWNSYEAVCERFQQGGYAGIGFVLTADDPYAFIDLDDTHGDEVAFERQLKIFREFNSYSERSPGGNGLHIIVKGEVPHGRKRASIEVYSNERYMTMTGNVYNPAQIEDRQELLSLLWEQMGGAAKTHIYGEDQEQKASDQEIYQMAVDAQNGAKFQQLWSGDWQGMYSSQSEADFALVDIIAFYTQNKAQIARLFRMSALGQRDKAQRDQYIGYMVEKSFDRQLPPVDIDGLRIQFETLMRNANGAAGEPGRTPAAPATGGPPPPAEPQRVAGEALTADASPAVPVSGAPRQPVNFPPGLVGDVARFILDQSPRPVPEIALAGAIGMLAGIAGRAYNISSTGLNQYVILIAKTGRGKEAIPSGISKLMQAVRKSVPAASEFTGPVEIASGQALLKWLEQKPSVYSIIGEFGWKLKEMAAPNAAAHTAGLKRTLLDLFNKSGKGNVLGQMAYSEREKNTTAVLSPAFTLIGESTPRTFYDNLHEGVVSDGLLPRFLIVNYDGERPALNKAAAAAVPAFDLIDKMAQLCAHCLSLGSTNQVVDVQVNKDAEMLLDSFDKFCDANINDEKQSETSHELWNRAHIKALKLAALYAVGMNYINPVVTLDLAQRATDDIYAQTLALKARFDEGEVGGGNSFNLNAQEDKQMAMMMRVIGEWVADNSKPLKYRVPEDMSRDCVFTFAALNARFIAQSVFKNDRLGATAAIKRTYQQLIDADYIREMPKQQMVTRYGKHPRSFVVANPGVFIEAFKASQK